MLWPTWLLMSQLSLCHYSSLRILLLWLLSRYFFLTIIYVSCLLSCILLYLSSLRFAEILEPLSVYGEEGGVFKSNSRKLPKLFLQIFVPDLIFFLLLQLQL